MASKSENPSLNKTPSFETSIGWVYRVYFLYLDPVFFMAGVYLIISKPTEFLINTIPHPLTISPTITSPLKITPITQLLLTNIASLYFCLSINQQLILRISNELNVWKAVMASLVMSDVGHLYAVWQAAPERMLQVTDWTQSEGLNIGILVLGLLIRLAFLAGIGNKK